MEVLLGCRDLALGSDDAQVIMMPGGPSAFAPFANHLDGSVLQILPNAASTVIYAAVFLPFTVDQSHLRAYSVNGETLEQLSEVCW
jgi:hypothetical protein